MPKVKALSGLESRIYLFASQSKGGIITRDIIESWGLAGKKVLDVILSRMARKGWLLRLKRGVYLVQKPGEKGVVPDVYCASQLIFRGYIAFSTALYLHGLSDEVPFTVYIATVKTSKKKKLGKIEIKAVALEKRALGTTEYKGYFISTVPKTIYDCLHIPEYGGGYPKILKAVHLAKMKREQWNEFIGYIERFESDAFCQKVGYLLTMLKKTKTKIPASVLAYLKKRVKSVVKLGKGKGKFNRGWRVVDAIGEKTLLAWWLHG